VIGYRLRLVRFLTGLRLSGGFGCRNGLAQDAAKRVAFLHQDRDPFCRKQLGENDEFEPTASFDH
jgi:hypothetical protein